MLSPRDLVAGALVLGGACTLPGGTLPETGQTVELSDPKLTALDVACSTDEDEWVIEANASSWTAGAELVWTTDGEYVETHAVPSVEADADGLADRLKLTLAVADDFRTVTSGSSTAFRCAEEPAWVLTLWNTYGDATHCAFGGGDPELWRGLPEPPACPLTE